MVMARQYGRLGNNLFQRAAAIGYAMKHGLQYDLCAWFASGWASNRDSQRILIKESGHHYQELPAYKARNGIPTVLDGYWQSEKYFAHCREEVLKAFGYIQATFPCVCSIHVRRGDYLNYPDKHPVINDRYINKAITEIRLRTGVSHFKFFSDDIEWCKSYVSNYRGVETFDFSIGRSENEDLQIMSCCEHNIISNSSFSWWGAWLNQNPDKIVVSPSKDNWFGPGNSSLCTDDIIPETWIQIKY